jgi:hypothetical protein
VEASAAPLVVVFTGLPGTGKSTMSDLTARRAWEYLPSLAIGCWARFNQLTGCWHFSIARPICGRTINC